MLTFYFFVLTNASFCWFCHDTVNFSELFMTFRVFNCDANEEPLTMPIYQEDTYGSPSSECQNPDSCA